jgi:arginyl-tRNA synthetase
MIRTLKTLCLRGIINKFPDLHKLTLENKIEIFLHQNFPVYHFQLDYPMKLSKISNIKSILIANTIKDFINSKTYGKFVEIMVSDPGFVNFRFKTNVIEKYLKKMLYKNIIKKHISDNILIDYSSPNIAKEMHVGHLRSTIIGECLSNILKYLGHKITKISHLGDWGTQFGILIRYIKEFKSDIINNKNLSLEIISNYYKKANILFDTDLNFKINARQEVINFQNENNESIKIWKIINKISQKEYKKIYKILGIKNIKCKGESFYKKLLNPLVKNLSNKGFLLNSNGAKCIYFDHFKGKDGKLLPFIILKSDGGFNYATSDLAALYYRIYYNKINKIIYITDIGQNTHFHMLFNTAKYIGFNKFDKIKLIHIGLGLMLNKDGKKIKTRSGESEKLLDLLKYSILKTKTKLKERNKNLSKKILEKNSKSIGINTIKYAELSNKLNQNYVFEYEKMIKFNGNTATFLMYAFARINSIEKNFKNLFNISYKNNLSFKLNNEYELILSLYIIQFEEILNKTSDTLNPNILTYYLYQLAEKFHLFFHKCQIINSDTKYERFLLCKLTKKVMKICFDLLGFTLVKRM